MHNKKDDIDVNNLLSLSTIILISSIAPIVLLAAPALVGIFISTLGLTPQHSGYLISSEMAGMGLATLPALFWVKAISWQRVASVALIVAAVGQLVTVTVDSFGWLLAVRFITGLATGTLMSVCLVSINLTVNPDRVFGLWVVGQLSFGSLVIAVLPSVVGSFGVAGFYVPLAVVLLLLIFLVNHLPTHTPSTLEKYNVEHSSQSTTFIRVCMGVIGVFVFYSGLSGAWTYIERIGNGAGLDISVINNALVLSSMAGIVGALSASVLSAKWGRLWPASLGFVLMVTSLILLTDTIVFVAVTPVVFLLAACLFKFTWTFTLPYLLSSISDNDTSGRSVVAVNFVIGGGLAAGPAISAMVLTGNNYAVIMWMSALFMVLCLLLFLPLLFQKST
jgi:predicted MFS family arabinose efflux permease